MRSRAFLELEITLTPTLSDSTALTAGPEYRARGKRAPRYFTAGTGDCGNGGLPVYVGDITIALNCASSHGGSLMTA